ncbi:hypothetical protein M407DRAFT_243323 [Tulasnella calospora MUT 4182]|uniref:Uncharacterized protein n=1 Tax=Tulasnella calospora MUT 4182 TaxID=1051891 RepID=A0A0C3QJU5_9AGAM|nr:hypothetical protein M407DRAFT_243323 [Tulasnella calospora MUT 4182]
MLSSSYPNHSRFIRHSPFALRHSPFALQELSFVALLVAIRISIAALVSSLCTPQTTQPGA